MSGIDWSKAPEGATAWDARPHADKTWMRRNWRPNRGWDYWGIEHWIYYGHIPDDQVLKMTHRPEQAAWSGEGLPPVGTVCELLFKGLSQGVVTVQYISDQFAVCKNHEYEHEQGAPTNHYEFRLIRTPEQIAEDLRKSEIDDICTIIVNYYQYPKGSEQYLSLATHLHDCLLRKVTV